MEPQEVTYLPFVLEGVGKQMRPIYEASCMQLIITSKCNLRCMGCSQLIGHRPKDYEMSLTTLREALESLQGFPNSIGIFGGEPTLHSKFKDVLELYSDYVPYPKRAFWSNGAKWKEYEDIIQKTFPEKQILFNDHKEDDGCMHQPTLVASGEIIQDKKLLWEIIGKCWVQNRWSPAVTPSGGFFCEVASALDSLFHLGRGYALWNGWWRKTPAQFQDQVMAYCRLCSMCIPFPPLDSHGAFEYISPNNLMKLMKLNTPNLSRFEVYTKEYGYAEYNKYAPNWAPWKFRSFYSHGPGQQLEKE